jgi:hypothetical protein
VADGDADITDIPYIFRINYMYYSILGFLIFALVGYPVSIFTGSSEYFDEKLLAPFLRQSYLDDKKVKNLQKNIDDFIDELKILRVENY